jgi:hypothetical protein
MAVTLDCAPLSFPDPMQKAVRYLKRHSVDDIQGWLNDPNVFFIHPVTMEMDAPERRLIRALRDGCAIDFAAFEPAFDGYQPPPPRHKRWRQSSITPLISRLYDTYLRVMPE